MMTSLIWTLACPLGMAAMGGIAWVLGRFPGRRAGRLASLSSRATCMPMGAQRQPTDPHESTDANAGEKVPAHV